MDPPAKVSVTFPSSLLEGAVGGGIPLTLSTSSWKMGRNGKVASVRDGFTTGQGLAGAVLGADTRHSLERGAPEVGTPPREGFLF